MKKGGCLGEGVGVYTVLVRVKSLLRVNGVILKVCVGFLKACAVLQRLRGYVLRVSVALLRVRGDVMRVRVQSLLLVGGGYPWICGVVNFNIVGLRIKVVKNMRRRGNTLGIGGRVEFFVGGMIGGNFSQLSL